MIEWSWSLFAAAFAGTAGGFLVGILLARTIITPKVDSLIFRAQTAEDVVAEAHLHTKLTQHRIRMRTRLARPAKGNRKVSR